MEKRDGYTCHHREATSHNEKIVLYLVDDEFVATDEVVLIKQLFLYSTYCR